MRTEPLPRWARVIGMIVVAVISIPFIIVNIAAQAKDTRR